MSQISRHSLILPERGLCGEISLATWARLSGCGTCVCSGEQKEAR